MLAIDTVLQNRYRIVLQLGQGGMGAVYKAIDERLNKIVAIKELILDLQTADDEDQRNLIQKAFQREANSLVKAEHEAVPDITDYFSELERSYLVMEYVEGDDLAKMLEKRGAPFSFEEVLPWINQLLEVLEYLHNLVPPIIHRDIKPQNLKLNERQKIKLLDFGIARNTDKNAAITQSTFLAATLNYAPFEQVLRVISPIFREFVLLKHTDKAKRFLEQDTDARCDVFGVGATFYHLLTNQAPADVTNRALKIWEKGTDELINPSEINPEIPPSVSEWLLKAMAFEREDRFSSASEMKLALQKIIAERKEGFSITGQEEIRHNEAVNTRENQLMQVRTERLIEPEKTEGEISSSDKFPVTAGSLVNTETTGVKISETDFPAQATAGNFAGQTFINEKSSVDQPVPLHDKIRPPQPEKSANNNRKYILALVIYGILILTVSGVGLYTVFFLISDENHSNENNQRIENINIAQTPENTRDDKENLNTAQANTETNAETNTETNTATVPNTTVGKEPQKTPTPAVRPSVTPTSKVVVEQTLKPTPTARPTVNKTPSPKAADYYVVCYVKSDKGTVDKIRKNRCTECPKDVLCELVFINKKD